MGVAAHSVRHFLVGTSTCALDGYCLSCFKAPPGCKLRVTIWRTTNVPAFQSHAKLLQVPSRRRRGARRCTQSRFSRSFFCCWRLLLSRCLPWLGLLIHPRFPQVDISRGHRLTGSELLCGTFLNPAPIPCCGISVPLGGIRGSWSAAYLCR